VRRASESLSVRHVLSTQRRTGCAAWCEERAGAAAGAVTTWRAGGVIVSDQPGKKARLCEAKRSGRGFVGRAPARIREHDRAFIRPTVLKVHTISIYSRYHWDLMQGQFHPALTTALSGSA